MNYFDVYSATLINLSQAFPFIESLIYAIAYLTGMVFFFLGIVKLKKVAESRQGQGGERLNSPFAYLIGGTFLMLLPETLKALLNSSFGAGNYLLQYSNPGDPDVASSMSYFIQIIGIIWIIRGITLRMTADQPILKNHGKKAWLYIIGGVLALNVQGTQNVLLGLLAQLMHYFS